MGQFNTKKECRQQFDALGERIIAFCGTDSFNNVLQKLCSMYPDTLSLKNGTLYYMGRLPRSLAFNDENVFNVESKCETDVKTAVSNLVKKASNADKYMRDLVLGFLTLKTIFFQKDELCQSAMSKIVEQAQAPVVEVAPEPKPVEPKKPVKKEFIDFEILKQNDKKQKHSFSVPFGAANGQVFSLQYPDKKSALFITEEGKFESKNKAKFRTYINRLVFGTMLSFPVNMVEFAFIESPKVDFCALDSVQKTLGMFKETLKAEMSQYMYDNVAKGRDSALTILSELSDLCNERQTIILNCKKKDGTDCETIEDYNEANPKNPLRYVVLFVHGYPDLCQQDESFELLKRVISRGGESGVYTIVIGQNQIIPKGFNGEGVKLEYDELDMDELVIAEDATATYQDMQFSIESDFIEDFNLADDEKKYIADRQKMASQYFLNDILEESSDGQFNKIISVPLGDHEGNTYSMSTSTGSGAAIPFTLVLGKSGSGKSAFLHSFIMSTATKYSPEEVQFHLIDFKTEGGSAEFKDYVKKPGEDNLYIPHVKYMSMQSKPENAVDVLNYIKYLMNKNSQIGKFREYNDRPDVKNGKKPKMPMTYVIIDEYKWLIEGGASGSDTSVKKKIAKDLKYILMTARAFGIGIIFSGQTIALDKDEQLPQIGNRIAFANDPDIFSTLFYTWRRAMYTRFPKGDAVKGYAYVADGINGTPKFVRMAFSGDPTSQRMRDMAKHIRQKYKNSDTTQIIAGVVGSASLEHDYKNWDDTIQDVINAERNTFANDENALRDFEQSGMIEAYNQMRPIPLGISSMTLLPVNMEYSVADNSKNYFAFAPQNVLRRIEQNASIAFVKLTAQYKNSKVYFCVDEKADFDQALGEVLKKYPFIKDRIQVVCGAYNIAQLIVSLEQQIKDGQKQDPCFVLMHDVVWMTNDDWYKEAKSKDKQKQKPAKQATPAPTSGKKSANVSSQLAEYKASMSPEQIDAIKKDFGLTTEEELDDLLIGMLNIDVEAAAQAIEAIELEEKQEESEDEQDFTVDDFKKAFAYLYLRGNRQEAFMLVTANDYNTVIKDVILSLEKNPEEKKVLSEYAVFANKAEKESHRAGVANANTCLIMPSDTQIRMYDYMANESKDWWQDLKNDLMW